MKLLAVVARNLMYYWQQSEENIHAKGGEFKRKYHVRTVTHTGERELAFEDSNGDYDIPMRSSDKIIFYWSEEPKIVIAVYNLTINQYSSIYWHLYRDSVLGRKYPDIVGLNETSLVVSKYLEDPEFKKDFNSLIFKPLAQIPKSFSLIFVTILINSFVPAITLLRFWLS